MQAEENLLVVLLEHLKITEMYYNKVLETLIAAEQGNNVRAHFLAPS
jgi:hypothetical protein